MDLYNWQKTYLLKLQCDRFGFPSAYSESTVSDGVLLLLGFLTCCLITWTASNINLTQPSQGCQRSEILTQAGRAWMLALFALHLLEEFLWKCYHNSLSQSTHLHLK